MKNLSYVQETFDYLIRYWHNIVDGQKKTEIVNSINMMCQQRRKWLKEYLKELWNNTLLSNSVHAKYKTIMNMYERQLKFVLLNFLYRNPEYFTMPLQKRSNDNRCAQSKATDMINGNVCFYSSVDALRKYLDDCTKTQISHLHVTVKKQQRIIYTARNLPFVILGKIYTSYTLFY